MTNLELIYEDWRYIPRYEGLYIISTRGRILRPAYLRWCKRNGSFSRIKEKFIKHADRGNGYLFVVLTKEREDKSFSVHRLIAITFISNPENKLEVNHLDGIPQNNVWYNFEWVTRQENALHSVNVLKKNVGDSHGNRKINMQSVLKIRELYYNRGITKETSTTLSKKYNLSVTVITKIVNGDSWGKAGLISEKGRRKTPIMVSKNGTLIKEYESIDEASKDLGLSPKMVSWAICKKKPVYKGYVFIKTGHNKEQSNQQYKWDFTQDDCR